VVAALALPGLPAGCSETGALLYFLGAGRGRKVEAQYRLGDGPIAILIDDIEARVDYPPTFGFLFDELAQELLRNKAATKIVPRQTVDQLRQSLPDFEKRGAREVGELAGADQVLWIEVQDFLAEEQVADALSAAYMNVSVKVLNAREKQNRSRVRLWPLNPKGQPVGVTLTASEVQVEKTKKAISQELATRLAVQIARLFYEHRLDDLERRP
jgi:hypothetical protein